MFRLFSILCVMISCSCLAPLAASEHPQFDYEFNQDRMFVDRGEIFIISSFKDADAVTVYNYSGHRLWEVKFHAKILSWSVQSNFVIVFSKDRNGHSTYLTCLDRSGRILWQKP